VGPLVTIPDALQAIIAGQLRQRVPGLSMAVIKDDRVQWAQALVWRISAVAGRPLRGPSTCGSR
jgi:hypothetical protein